MGNNNKSCDSKKNDTVSHDLRSEGQKEMNARSNTVGIDGNSSDQKDGTMGPEGQNISLHNRSSTMSEISDGTLSSKGRSGSVSDSGDGTISSSDLIVSDRNTSSDECETEDQSESSSVSSTAAVT